MVDPNGDPDSLEFEKNLKKVVEVYAPYYNLHRNQIIQEDLLINHRLTWLLFPQAALLTAYLTIGSQKVISFFITYVGLGLTLLSSYGILIAIRSGMDAIKKYDENARHVPPEIQRMLPGIVGFPDIKTLGWLAPVGFCFVFLVAWSVLEVSRHQGFLEQGVTAVSLMMLLIYWLLITNAMLFSKDSRLLHRLIPFIKPFERIK